MAISLGPDGLAANGFEILDYNPATGQLELFHNNVAVLQTVSGGVQASTFTGSLSGNAATATRFQTARNITLTGDVTGSVSFNGASNVSISTTVASAANATTSSKGIAQYSSTNFSVSSGTVSIKNDGIARANLKDEVQLIIYNSAGTAVKTLYGAGS